MQEIKTAEVEIAPQPSKTVITDRAMAQIRALKPEGPCSSNVRLVAQGGGCAGLAYKVVFSSEQCHRDRIWQFDGLRFFVDPKSFIYLHGMTLDYMDEATQKGFIVVNPGASKGCGCGSGPEKK
jgi:iron-sulfur cluster assembly protein